MQLFKRRFFAKSVTEETTESIVDEVLAHEKARPFPDFEEDEDEGAPIHRLASTVIRNGIKEGASQILLEPDRKSLRVRLRIDGILHEAYTMPNYVQVPLKARILTIANMDSTAQNVPREGSLGVTYKEMRYDVRISTLPTAFGEQLSLRILDHSQAMQGLNKLGLTAEVQAQTEELLQRPGLLIFAGAAGSGKIHHAD